MDPIFLLNQKGKSLNTSWAFDRLAVKSFLFWNDDAGEGGSGGDGADNSGDQKTIDGDGKSQDGGDDGAQHTRPEYFPEKLWGDGSQYKGEDGTLNHQAMNETLADAYKQAERRIFMRTDDLKKEVAEEMAAIKPEGVPEKPSEYALDKLNSLQLPDGMEFTVNEDDPLLLRARDVLHEHNIPQAAFDDLLEGYMESQLAGYPNYDKEMEELGDYADMRCERVNSWCKEHLSEDGYASVAGMAVKAEFVKVFEEMMELSGEPKFSVNDEGSSFTDSMTREEIAQLQNTQEYRNGDPVVTKKVRAAFQRIAAQEARG